MSEPQLGTWIDRVASAVSRRGSLAVMAGAALTATHPGLTAAKAKKNKKKNTAARVKRLAARRCKSQVEQCQQFIQVVCGSADPPVPDCLSKGFACCDSFASCNALEALNCIGTISGG